MEGTNVKELGSKNTASPRPHDHSHDHGDDITEDRKGTSKLGGDDDIDNEQKITSHLEEENINITNEDHDQDEMVQEILAILRKAKLSIKCAKYFHPHHPL